LKHFLKNFLKNLKNKSNISIFINLNKKISGLQVVLKEKGFLISFIKKNYFTFHLRPKLAAHTNLSSSVDKYNSDTAIIIQGGIEDPKFIEETVKIYDKIFPNSFIILSTWENEDIANINNLNLKNKLKIIQSQKPDKPGHSNINLQLKSTSVAINYAKTLNCEFVLKTRTDCRIYKPNVLKFFKSLITQFPGRDIPERILAGNIATCMFRIYGLTDIILFGKTELMEKYFFYEDEDEMFSKYSFSKTRIINETKITGEILLCARYLKTINHKLLWTMDDWWNCLNTYFCIFSCDEIDFFWKTYNWEYEKKLSRSYCLKTNRLVDFSDWLNIFNDKNYYSNYKYKETFEYVDGIIKKIKVM